jgi:hypothetical protein
MFQLPLSELLRSDRLIGGDADSRSTARAPAQFTRRVGWGLLASYLGRQMVRAVCGYMARHLVLARGAPTLESARGIVRLWRIDRLEEISSGLSQPWRLEDGTVLKPCDPVLDFHIVAAPLYQHINQGEPWKQVLEEEFRSLAAQLAQRDEAAVYGTTILWRQVAAFGASTRATPPGLFAALDTFYREMILLAFHPAGINRVLWHRHTITEAAISRVEFCRRYGAEPAGKAVGSGSAAPNP